MKNYINKKQFIEAVESNDHFEIKHEILSLIFFFDGEQNKINEAIQYAIDNSTFKFEAHIPIDKDNQDNINEDHYAQLSINFTKNSSKERLSMLFSVYDQVFKNKKSPSFEELYPPTKEFPIKQIAIGAGAILALLILYKILS